MRYYNSWMACARFNIYFLSFLLMPASAYASYIEATIGTAVVNDATASYYNPAALTLLKNSQVIPLINIASFRTQFNGTSTTVSTRYSESGTSKTMNNYFSPTFYLAIPVNQYVKVGFASVSNFANRNPEEHSILRYTQSSNRIQDYDFVPAIGVKINENFAMGANLNFSHLDLDLHPLTGFPGSNVADSKSQNQSNGNGIGMDVGSLLTLSSSTLIGLNYRSVTTYNESGKSQLNVPVQIISKDYHFKLHTPARITLTVSQAITSHIRLMTTLQHIQWDIIRFIDVYNIATVLGETPAIINARIPQHLKNTWALTVGTQYRFSPTWILRIAGTYNQSPYNPHYQISNGNSYILGTSVGYDINKTIKIDGSYAHVFMKSQSIDINGNRFLVSGTNKGSRNAVSLKLTVDLV